MQNQSITPLRFQQSVYQYTQNQLTLWRVNGNSDRERKQREFEDGGYIKYLKVDYGSHREEQPIIDLFTRDLREVDEQAII